MILCFDSIFRLNTQFVFIAVILFLSFYLILPCCYFIPLYLFSLI